MLPEKPWKAEAILRLIARVVVCIFLGALINAGIDYLRQPHLGHPLRFGLSLAAAAALFVGALLVLAREWQLESFTRNALTLGTFFYGGLILTWMCMRALGQGTEVGRSAVDVMIAVIAFQGAALVLVHWFLREHQVGWAEAFGFRRQPGRALMLGIAVCLLFVPLGWGLQYGSAYALEHFRVQPQEQEAVQVLRATESFANRLLLGVSAVLIAPVAEEILFRGILYPAIKQRGFPGLAWWGTSLLFGAVHLNLETFLPLTVLALCLVWLYEKTDNLLAPIAAHTLFNAMNFAAVFLVHALEGGPGKP